METGLSISAAFYRYRSDFILMKNQSLKTMEAYDNTRLLLVRKFGEKDICTLSFEDARKWHEWLSGWQEPDTVRGNIICLRNVLKFLKSKGLQVMNYEDIPVQKRAKRSIQYLTEEQVKEFITEVGTPFRGYSALNRKRNVAIVKFLYATGVRNSELCALNRDSIKDRTFTVVGKSKEPRIVFLDEETNQTLNEYLALRTDNNNALFISHHTGQRLSSPQLRNVFMVVCARSKKFRKVHPHTIRHSYATKLLNHKVDLRYIGALMGHQDLNTTKMYTHYANPQLKEIYDKAHV